MGTITEEEVEEAVKKMKTGKALAVGIKWLTRLFNLCFTTRYIQTEWRRGVIVPIWKGKREIHDPGRYRGITLLSQALEFRKGGGTDDGLVAIRQIIWM